MKLNYKSAGIIITGLISFAAGVGGCYLYNKPKIDFASRYSEAMECENVLSELKVPYPELSESEKINIFLSNYGKYTRYVEDESDEVKIIGYVNSLPTAKGMGFVIDISDDGRFYVSEVQANSEAEKQGLKTGDVILSVAGEDVYAGDLTCMKKIGGKKGTELKMSVLRDGKAINLDLNRINADVSMTAELESKKIGSTLYIKLERIDAGDGLSVMSAISNDNFSSIIIDLRQNGGGEVGGAIAIADVFAKSGVYEEHSYDGEGESYYLNDSSDECDVPIAILVDNRTASASEILTALLKQNTNTTIVGVNTFGKGIYQNKVKFKNGILTYTAGTFTVGDWPCWQGVGIAPDIEVKMDPDLIGTDDDIQLQKALEILG